MVCFIFILGNDGTVCKDFRNIYMYILYLYVVSLNIIVSGNFSFRFVFFFEIMRSNIERFGF